MSSLSLKHIGMPRSLLTLRRTKSFDTRPGRDIRPFFELLGKHGNNIEAVAMDMNTAFDLEVCQYCPTQKQDDLFHVVAKFGRSWIESGRPNQLNSSKE
ncbi:transposase [Vibrio chagasii]|nr:transposase [Vibrio chagasii]